MHQALHATNFTNLDWVIVVVYLCSSIVIGLWANRYVGNLSDYLVAGRTLRIRLALATMTGTELGLVTVMYSSELGFTQQYASLYLSLLEGLALLAIGGTGFVVYRLRATEVLTVPEYYQKRYSQGVRVLGGAIMVIAGVLNMGLFLKAGSEFITAVSGLSDPTALKWIMTALLALVLFYTVLGGMVSVVITDLIQFIVLGFGMLVLTYYVYQNVGYEGFAGVVTNLGGYFDPTDSTNPASMHLGDKAGGIGHLTIVVQAAVIFSAAILWPTSASRTLSVKTPKTAKQLYLFSTIPFLARRAFPVFWGIGAYAFFFGGAGAELSGPLVEAMRSTGPDHINGWTAMPLFLAKIVPTGLLGLITAGMIAAFMSTHDSYLLCWSGVITQDVIAPVFGPLSQNRRILITRISILAIGAVLLIWGLWYELEGNLWGYMAVTGTIYLAGAAPVIIGGLYWRGASTVGAYVALLGGIIGALALDPVINGIKQMANGSTIVQSLQPGHMTLAAFVISTFGFIAGSLLFPNKTER